MTNLEPGTKALFKDSLEVTVQKSDPGAGMDSTYQLVKFPDGTDHYVPLGDLKKIKAKPKAEKKAAPPKKKKAAPKKEEAPVAEAETPKKETKPKKSTGRKSTKKSS